MRVPSSRSATGWVSDSLARGGPLATEVRRRRRIRGPISLLTEPGALASGSDLMFDDTGRGLSLDVTRRAAKRELADLATTGRSLVVEDDLGRRGDPGLGVGVVYLGERVARVFRLAGPDDVSTAVNGLFRGASGYPANAFIVASASVSAETSPWELSPAQVRGLADDAVAVVVSVFDAETYLLAYLTARALS